MCRGGSSAGAARRSASGSTWYACCAATAELPLLVIAELVGCPVEDRGKLFDWSNTMIGFEDPDFAMEEGATDAMAQMFEYAGHPPMMTLRRSIRSDRAPAGVETRA